MSSTLRVVPMNDIQTTLTKLYEQLGEIGRDRFCALVCRLVLIGRQRHESAAAGAELRGNSKRQPQVAEVLVGLNAKPVQHDLHVLLN